MQNHISLRSTTPEATGNFLRELFGWFIETQEFGGEQFTFFKDKAENPEIGGDIEFAKSLPSESTCIVYFYAGTDIQAMVDKAMKLGATVQMPVTSVAGGMVFCATIVAPGGSHLGLWMPPPANG